ncbi:MAG: ssDNA-binding domain-containing protein [Halorhodospira halophila]|uniref:ArdC family protein n=1 Tax=Halorhodospira TaxID=85108 RepID=UPI001EE9A783|nr:MULTISPECIES: zincin-like metallopeptidase domain-containing protein [Halorhodospira]MCC3750842.1 ssDNA-binding domain-containing protein [Halorhodospira halophila]MCG5537337.1 ssDNA-binding domain-containing protein [Halorhodospira sp. 9622]
MAEQKRDLYQEVTDKIINALEEGVVPWVQPWDDKTAAIASGFPVNALNDHPYRGTNTLILWAEQAIRGYSTSRWLTFKQAKEAGGHVRKGEKGTLATFFKRIPVQKKDRAGNPVYDEEGNPETKIVPFIRGFTLFNLDQVEGLDERYWHPGTVSQELDSVEAADAIVEASGADIVFRGTRAAYTPELDRIQMPPQESFGTSEGFYATLLHELSHWTGHSDRLARPSVIRPASFGSEDYAFEELVAELSCAYLCAEIGMQGDLRHEGYIASWLKALRGDKTFIFRASSEAKDAAAYLSSSVEGLSEWSTESEERAAA